MPSSIEDDLRKDFKETNEKSEKVKVSSDNVEDVLTNEKKQIAIDPSGSGKYNFDKVKTKIPTN